MIFLRRMLMIVMLLSIPLSAWAEVPARSTELKYRIYLKNGQNFESAIGERDTKGLWAETAPGMNTYFLNAEIAKIEELGKTITVTQKVAEPIVLTAKKAAAPVPVSPPAKTNPKPSLPAGKPEGEELLEQIQEAIQDRDTDKLMSLYFAEGVAGSTIDSLKPFAKEIVTGTIESMTLKLPDAGDNEVIESEGFRYTPVIPIIGNIRFVLKEYPGQHMSLPFGKKEGKYYLVTSVKQAIPNYVPPPSGPVLLDGKTYEGRTGKTGEATGEEDIFTFKDGKFTSAVGAKKGYDGGGAYDAKMNKKSIEFSAETTSFNGGKKSWWGFIAGESLSGGVTTVEHGQTEEGYFMGTLKNES